MLHRVNIVVIGRIETQLKQLNHFSRYDGGIFMNFNGGKDCTAVLHLWATVLKLNKSSPPICLYVSEDPFPEVDIIKVE